MSSDSGTLIARVARIDVSQDVYHYIFGLSLDAPKVGFYVDCSQVLMSGWIAAKSNIVAVKAAVGEESSQAAAIHLPRPDVLRADPNWTGAERSGFRILIEIVSSTSQVAVNVDLEDGRSFCLATVHFQFERPVPSPYVPKYQPAVLTALGRSGTTWFMRLLSNHPQVVAHQKYPYETKISYYWMQVFRTLRDTLNIRNADPRGSLPPGITLDKLNPFNYVGMDAPEIVQWFSRSHSAQLQHFCQSSIDQMYDVLRSGAQHDEFDAKRLYFLEKNHPHRDLVLELYPAGREIILVRDFRDVVCSITAFNRKRGFQAFDRQRVGDDATYVREVVGNEVAALVQRWRDRKATVCLVRYEDLLADPIAALGRVTHYLGVDSSVPLLSEVVRRASQTDSAMAYHQTSASAQASIGRWKTDLDDEVLAVCDEVFSDALDEFSYDR